METDGLSVKESIYNFFYIYTFWYLVDQGEVLIFYVDHITEVRNIPTIGKHL